MGLARRVLLLALSAVWLACLATCVAQFNEPQRANLSDAVSIDMADNRAMTHLKRVREYLDSEQWANAVDTLRRVMEEYGDGLVQLEEFKLHEKDPPSRRYASIRHFCQLRLTALPPEALTLYRGQVDALARREFERAAKTRDGRRLAEVVDSFFCSSVGDDALLFLGDLALEQGDYPAARDYWSRMTPLPAAGTFDKVPKAEYERVRNSAGLPKGDAELLDASYELIASPFENNPESAKYRLREGRELTPEVERRLARLWTWHGLITVLKYPDEPNAAAPTDIDARLVLASILEGSLERAEREVKRFAELHPEARGRLRGRRVLYGDALKQVLEESREWPQPARRTDWPTFGGADDRNGFLPGEIDIAEPAWTIPLPKVEIPDPRVSANHGFRPRRVAEDDKGPLSLHPVVSDGKVLFADGQRVYAFKLSDGKPVWPSIRNPTSGVIYPPGSDGTERAAGRRQGYLGAPRYTLSVHGDKLFVRMGTPVTSSIEGGVRRAGTYLRWFDLANEGRLIQTIEAPDEWAFDGTPVTDGSRVYVAQRRRGATARTRLLCYDAENGRLLWQRYICGADTPSRGSVDECTHNLLTLHQDTLYYNTNLGAVAAVSTRDGMIKWITTYPRAKMGTGLNINKRPGHFYRDLTPCLYHNGMLYVAPSDHVGILAIIARTGQIVWSALDQESTAGDTAVHLLAARGNYLLASGDQLWWIDIGNAHLGQGGNAAAMVPLKDPYGRGVIVGDYAYIPTREEIHVFHHQTPGKIARQPIKLVPRKAGGGNLIATDTHLLIVGADTMYGIELAQPLSEAKKTIAVPAKPAPP